MVHDQQRDAFHFGGGGEAQDRLAAAMRPEPLERPPLVGDRPLRVEYLQQSFVAVRLRRGALLDLFDDRARILRADRDQQRDRQDSDRKQQRNPRGGPERAALHSARGRCASFSYSYSNASTSEPWTADSAGHSAATNAAPRIVGTSASTVPYGNA